MKVRSEPITEFTQNCMNMIYLKVRATKFISQHFFYLSSTLLIIESSKHLRRYVKRIYSISINKPVSSSFKSALYVLRTSQFFCKAVRYLFFSWTTLQRPPYRIFSNLKQLFIYCPDSLMQQHTEIARIKSNIIKETSLNKRLDTLVLKSTHLESLEPLQRLKLKRLDIKFGVSELITSRNIVEKFANLETEVNFSFLSDEGFHYNFPIGMFFNVLKNTRSISIYLRQNLGDFLIFQIISINSFRMYSLRRLSLNFSVQRLSQFPDLNFLEKMNSLLYLQFRIDMLEVCDHEIFDLMKFPNSLKSLCLQFLHSSFLDLKNANLSKSFFYSFLKLGNLEDLELSFSENIPGIVRTNDYLTKNYFTYFIKRCWIFLPRKLAKLRLESPFLSESDDYIWRNLETHKNLEILELNLGGDRPTNSHTYRGKILLKNLKSLKLSETLYMLTYLTHSSFQKIEDCTIVTMEKNPCIDFGEVLNHVLMMKSLNSLEVFYFNKEELGRHEAEIIIKLFQNLKALRDIKITTMNAIDDTWIELMKNELCFKRRINNATLSFKNKTLKKYFSHTFIIQF